MTDFRFLQMEHHDCYATIRLLGRGMPVPEERTELESALKRIAEHQGHWVVVDFGKRNIVNSIMLGTLIMGLKMFEKHGGGMHLVCASQDLVNIFEVTGLHSAFKIFQTVEKAVAALPVQEGPRRPGATSRRCDGRKP